MKYLIPIIIVSLSGHAAVADQIRSYTIENFQPVNEANCDQEVTDFGERLAQAYGIEVTGARCELVTGTGNITGILSYRHSEALPLVTTDSSGLLFTRPGMYDTEEDCEADGEAQKDFFTRYVGNRPELAYCMQRSLERNHPGSWYWHMTGVQDIHHTAARYAPRQLSFYAKYPRATTWQAITDALTRKLAAQNTHVARYYWRPATVPTSMNMLVYTTSNPVLRTTSLGRFDLEAAPSYCQELTTRLNAEFEDVIARRYLTVYCESMGMSGPQVTVKLLTLNLSIQIHTAGNRYETLGACEVERERVATQFPSKHRLTSLCVGGSSVNDDYHVAILYKDVAPWEE